MRIQDYKNATNKLNDFVHQAKMMYDIEYKIMYGFGLRVRAIMESQIWGIDIDPDEYVLQRLYDEKRGQLQDFVDRGIIQAFTMDRKKDKYTDIINISFIPRPVIDNIEIHITPNFIAIK